MEHISNLLLKIGEGSKVTIQVEPGEDISSDGFQPVSFCLKQWMRKPHKLICSQGFAIKMEWR